MAAVAGYFRYARTAVMAAVGFVRWVKAPSGALLMHRGEVEKNGVRPELTAAIRVPFFFVPNGGACDFVAAMTESVEKAGPPGGSQMAAR